MRIDALKELLFTLSGDTKKHGHTTDVLKDYLELHKTDLNIELLMSKESMERDLQDILSGSFEP